MTLALALGMALPLAVPTAGGAAPRSCDGVGVVVEVEDDKLFRSVCGAARRAAALLRDCDLALPPGLSIVVADRLNGADARGVGVYHAPTGRITLLPPGGMDAARRGGSAFALIGDEVYFESIVVHEMAHAAYAHSSCRAGNCFENHEYVAYAMQMRALPAGERALLVAANPVAAPVDPMLLNPFILGLAPDWFAVAAWRHFGEEGRGCAFVQDLVTGAATLQTIAE